MASVIRIRRGERIRVAILANCGLATLSVYGALARRGHEVHLFTFHDRMMERTLSHDDWTGIVPHFLPSEYKWRPFRVAASVRPELEDIRPDVWHAHLATPFGIAGALARWHPFLLSTHGSDVYFRAWIMKSNRARLILPPGVDIAVFRALHAGLAAAVDTVVVYSPDMMGVLPRLGYPDSKLAACYLGIDTELFAPRSRVRNGGTEFRIVCTRGMEPLYDHKTVLEAAARLHREGIPVRLILAGDGSTRGFLEGTARELGIAKVVEFLGLVPHRSLPRLLSESDVMVSPARSDTTAMSVLEGMACGLPVVVTNVGSLAMRITDRENGFLFEPGDVTRLVEYLRNLWSDEPLRRRIGAQNARVASEKYDLKRTIDHLEGIYERSAG